MVQKKAGGKNAVELLFFFTFLCPLKIPPLIGELWLIFFFAGIDNSGHQKLIFSGRQFFFTLETME